MTRYSVKHIFLIWFFLFSLYLSSNAQRRENMVQYQAQITEVDKNIGKGAQRLLGNVVFTHEGARMYCDSAYFYSKTNSLDAFHNIYINQGDTLHLYGDFLHYDGNTRLAEITGRVVKLINKETTLTTTELDYNLRENIGFYTKKGHIVNQENTLNSRIGYYYARKKTFHFSDSVVITTPDYIIYADTLKYHTETGVATFLGPTNMIGDSSHIYCERGWYDTKKDLSELRQNAWADNMKQKVEGEYIFYSKSTGEGKARQNVTITDHEKNIILKGHYSLYSEKTDFAFMTDSAQFIQISETDSLFLHADSLISFPDTAGQKILQAYYNVRFFRKNVQGICDSLIYTFADSVARLYGGPVLWTENKQISAENINLYTRNEKIEQMVLKQAAFICSKEDTSLFNQIKGKDMICFFVDNELIKIDVKGNGQTVYYAKEEQDIVGVNKIECTNMVIHFEAGEVSHINFYINPVGVLYPMDQAPENELVLKGFEWLEHLRPQSKTDIF